MCVLYPTTHRIENSATDKRNETREETEKSVDDDTPHTTYKLIIFPFFFLWINTLRSMHAMTQAKLNESKVHIQCCLHAICWFAHNLDSDKYYILNYHCTGESLVCKLPFRAGTYSTSGFFYSSLWKWAFFCVQRVSNANRCIMYWNFDCIEKIIKVKSNKSIQIFILISRFSNNQCKSWVSRAKNYHLLLNYGYPFQFLLIFRTLMISTAMKWFRCPVWIVRLKCSPLLLIMITKKLIGKSSSCVISMQSIIIPKQFYQLNMLDLLGS